ncbi:glycosyltransferase family 2 protein [Winogradskyella sp. Asnod2-B02-A]|uniref:glycosyltransferase family 2 protein n=1 Tax=Winogradskyella sp. Asnod2-B02-A TaxID=3160583 RepID=UPI00386461D7
MSVVNSQPLVSIIIPTYNRAQLIGKTLDSVLAQTYKNWECIIVDDGSTDNTENLLNSYIDKDVRFQYYKRPDTYAIGGNGARNYGLSISKGEYINWFDDDDAMEPNKLEVQLSLLHQTNFDYNICQTMLYDIDNDKELGLRASHIVSNQIFQDYIRFKIFWLTQAPLWKRSFLETYNLKFNEDLKQSQDYDFHMRVLAISENYSFTEKPLVKVYCHAGNMSNSLVENEQKLKSNLFVKDEIFKRFGKKIDLETKRSVYNNLLELFSQVVYTRSLKKTMIVFPYLLKHISEIKLPFFKRISVFLKLLFGSFLYLTLKKGYSYLKIKI